MSQVAPDTHQIDDEARPGAWAADTSLDVIEVVGPDAVGYLQGQLSQNVSGLAVGAWAPSLLLEPQGKMCAWMRVHRAADDTVHLVVDAGFGTVVEQRLRRFWLRTKAELSTRFDVPTLAVRAWPDGLAVPAAEDVTPGGADPILVAPAPWPTHPGFDLIGDGATLSDNVVRLEGDAGRQALERARVASGVPAMGTEIGPDTIPAAARVVEASVDFTKGCYTGQELVARIDSRGNVTPTRLVLLTGDGEVPKRDAALSVDGTDRASVTTAVPAAGEGWTGLGYLHRTVDTPAELTLADGQPVHAVDPG